MGKLKLLNKNIIKVVSAFVVLCGIGFSYYFPLELEQIYKKQAYRFFDTRGDLLATIISDDGYYRMSTSLERVPKPYIQALLNREDRYFYWHYGINPISIVRAAFDNLIHGKVVSGGSTITMQLARMLKRRPRTFGAKLIELFRAIQIEFNFSKKEILEMYLSLAPYGGNIEGIEAASLVYFNKTPMQLSIAEQAALVSIPNSPNNLRPDKYPLKAQIRRDDTLKEMLEDGVINNDIYILSLKENLRANGNKFFNLIPHLSYRLKTETPTKYIWHTKIDRNFQLRVQNVLQAYLRSLNLYRIRNASVVIIDNKTKNVISYIGSQDYFDESGEGANDGIWSPRSPGSTLKPFVYGLALDKGVIGHKTVLYDVPINYAGYQPQNYAKDFFGMLRVDEALTESLNVVAVKLAKEVGNQNLYDLLKQGGIQTLNHSASYYGLPLILGGVEVRLLELVNLYTSFSHEGLVTPYYLVDDTPMPNSSLHYQVMSKEAAWIISHILTDVTRPDFPESWQFTKTRPTIAWKTGTSYGHQDAWSIGYGPKYTIGVWVGNFDGSPSVGLAGSKTAGPLLFEVIQSVHSMKDIEWFRKPSSVGVRKVCAACGTLPNKYCKNFIDEYYIANKKLPILDKICDIPQSITIDKRNGKQATLHTPNKFKEARVYNIYPSEISLFLQQHGVMINKVPSYDLKNMTGQKYYAPKILTPRSKTVHYKRLDILHDSDHGIKVLGATTNRVKKVHWYLDGKSIGIYPSSKSFIINPTIGDHDLLMIDDVGGRDSVKVQVRDFREIDAPIHL